ncbi:hypothetical protein AVEN_144520-1, partial [Araneus ventricosus]
MKQTISRKNEERKKKEERVLTVEGGEGIGEHYPMSDEQSKDEVAKDSE